MGVQLRAWLVSQCLPVWAGLVFRFTFSRMIVALLGLLASLHSLSVLCVHCCTPGGERWLRLPVLLALVWLALWAGLMVLSAALPSSAALYLCCFAIGMCCGESGVEAISSSLGLVPWGLGDVVMLRQLPVSLLKFHFSSLWWEDSSASPT